MMQCNQKMESRCSLIRENVTDKTLASRYTSSPAIQQLLLLHFIVSLQHKSQLPRRAGPRRPAPTIIKTELGLIELSTFASEYFCLPLKEYSLYVFRSFFFRLPSRFLHRRHITCYSRKSHVLFFSKTFILTGVLDAERSSASGGEEPSGNCFPSERDSTSAHVE